MQGQSGFYLSVFYGQGSYVSFRGKIFHLFKSDLDIRLSNWTSMFKLSNWTLFSRALVWILTSGWIGY